MELIHPTTRPSGEERRLAERVHAWWMANSDIWTDTALAFIEREAQCADEPYYVLAPHAVVGSLLRGDSPLDVQGGSARQIALLVVFIERLANDDSCTIPGLNRKEAHLTMDALRDGLRRFGSIRDPWMRLVADSLTVLEREGSQSTVASGATPQPAPEDDGPSEEEDRLEVTATADEEKPESDVEGRPLTPAEMEVWKQYVGAEQSLGSGCEDKAAYSLLKKSLGGDLSRTLGTWTRILRAARKKQGARKNLPRSRHVPTSSVISPDAVADEDLRRLKSDLDS